MIDYNSSVLSLQILPLKGCSFVVVSKFYTIQR